MYHQRELDDLIYTYFFSKKEVPIWEYLGWNEEEYYHYYLTNEQPRGTTTTD